MENIQQWIEQFHQDGFLVLPNILTKEQCSTLIEDLQSIAYDKKFMFAKRMFEDSDANLELFWQEPIVSFAEKLIADNGSVDSKGKYHGIGNANQVHVIHNNSFRIRANTAGLADSSWHQDDSPHITSLDGSPLTNVRLNVLNFTCLYYLTDVNDLSNGPTQIIKGSHLFGQNCNGDVEEHEDKIVSCLGPAGTVVMFNNQVWHRGAPNTSEIDRYCTQITYAKRLVGHKYGKFMNYQMPQHVIDKAGNDPRKLRLLGFLGHGAYG